MVTANQPMRQPGVDQKIWRYMDLAKFVSLLQNGTLYFARADRLSDPFEGSMPRLNVQNRLHFLDETISLAAKYAREPITEKELLEKAIEFDRTGRERMYLNCWHMNDTESVAMWHVYGVKKQGVAIRSSYSALRKGLPNDVEIACVEYIDFEKDQFTPHTIFSTFTHKRKPYAFERELRCMYVRATRCPGIAFPVCLQDLIHEVVVSPDAQEWFIDMVDRLLNGHKLNLKTTRSVLDGEPRY